MNYPREGCQLVIEVTPEGYHLAVFSPEGKKLEGYAPVKTPRAIGRMVEEWGSGYAPHLAHRLDQPPVLPWSKSADQPIGEGSPKSWVTPEKERAAAELRHDLMRQALSDCHDPRLGGTDGL
jgi:hypothetical protein